VPEFLFISLTLACSHFLIQDEQLRVLVAERGACKWSSIAKSIERKNSKQCRERWHNVLDPTINWEPFEQHEDETIIKMVKIEGFKWSRIAAYLPGRTDNHVKNRWNATLKRETQLGGRYYDKTNPLDLSKPPFVNPSKVNNNKMSPENKIGPKIGTRIPGIELAIAASMIQAAHQPKQFRVVSPMDNQQKLLQLEALQVVADLALQRASDDEANSPVTA
jgi:hypothetical protein